MAHRNISMLVYKICIQKVPMASTAHAFLAPFLICIVLQHSIQLKSEKLLILQHFFIGNSNHILPVFL